MLPPRHPSYARFADDWRITRACADGESAIKTGGVLFLPPTAGMIADGMASPMADGSRAYDAYRRRAVFPSVFAEAVAVALGVLHREPAVIELPSKLEPLLERATPSGEGLHALLRQINSEQLVTGRLGLLLDMPTTPTPSGLPYLALYQAETIVNWDEGLGGPSLVVLDESGEEIDDNDAWWKVERYRRLVLEDGAYTAEVREAGGLFRESFQPSIRGRRPDFLPFVFLNAGDLRSEPDEPPLIGLARLALAIYRLEADYRQALHMTGQDTLVVIGAHGEETYRVGAGASISVPRGGDAKFVGVSSEGLPEMRQALAADYARAARLGLGLIDTATRERESGEALKTRVAASTASLTSIALAGARGLETALRMAARWAGANENEVHVEANTDFTGDIFDPSELADLMTAQRMGAPISLRTVHDYLREKDLTSKEFEQELQEIADEQDGGADRSLEPVVDDPVDDPDAE
jgi:hypothetical protein